MSPRSLVPFLLAATLAGCSTGPDAKPPAGTGGNVSDGAVSTLEAARIAAPPTYLGSASNSATCTQEYLTNGFEPVGAPGARYPLFLHFTGTNFLYDAATFRSQVAPGADVVTEAMARRGFVALQVEYDNTAITWLSDHVGLLGCLFGSANPSSALAVLCALPQVDCELGIAVWGHSLGALVAHRAHDFDPRVRVAWLTGYGGDAQATLDVTRFRVVNGENDTTNGQIPTVNGIAGFTLAECPDDGRTSCLRPDGSGWIIVRQADCQTSTADHCWFDRISCTDSGSHLEPNWIDPSSTKPFALHSNADWVAEAVKRP